MNQDTSTIAPVQQSSTATPTEFSYNTEKAQPIIPTKKNLLHLYNDKNPLLSQVIPEIDMQNKPGDLLAFAQALLDTMNHYGGAGLAANQCGEPLRMFVMAGGIVCINPVILEVSDEEERGKEGCLSYPGLILPISRPKFVKVGYFNHKLEWEVQTYGGATGRVFQHELDHLNGKVFTSKVGSLTLQMAKKKKQKLFKKINRIVAWKQARGLK